MLFEDTGELDSFINHALRGFAECGDVQMTPLQRARILADSPLVTLERRLREGLLKPRKVLGRTPIEELCTRSAVDVEDLIRFPPQHRDGRRYLDNLQEAYAKALLTVLLHPGPEDWNEGRIKQLSDQLTEIHAIEGDAMRVMRGGRQKRAYGNSSKLIRAIIKENPAAKAPKLWGLLRKAPGVEQDGANGVKFHNGSRLKRDSFLSKVSKIKKETGKRAK